MPAVSNIPAAAPDREASLSRAAEQGVDVLVVGGGITGAGIALDAVTRGYRVALVERGDLASGTSSRSSKLVHGGLRYLAQRDVAMVAESLRERELLRRLAPHLVRPLTFVVPLADRRVAAELRAGLVIYDTVTRVSGGSGARTHRHLDHGELLRAAPALVTGFDAGGLRYEDCQTDDARLTLQVAQTARQHGALVANHAEAIDLLHRGGRVAGAVVRDRLTGDRYELRARWTVSAAGVWADRVRQLAHDASAAAVVPARGSHLVFRRRDVPAAAAVVVPSGIDDRRRVFVVPWGDQVYIGTTDEAYGEDRDRPHATTAEADYLLAAVNAAFGLDLTVGDAVGAWSGLRPLSAGVGGVRSQDLSRRHAVTEDPPGLLSIVGGKLTTFRQMAEDLVDALVERDTARRGPCVTRTIALGSEGPAEAALARLRVDLRGAGLPDGTVAGLYHRHGDRAAEVVRFCHDHDGLDVLVPGLPYLRGEVRWAVRNELASTVDDVLQRRLRVSVRDAAAGGQAIGQTADIVADEVGLTSEQRDSQVAGYLAAVRHERGPVPLTGRVGAPTATPTPT